MYLRIYRVAKSQTKQHHTVRNTTTVTLQQKKNLEYNYVMCAWLFGLTLASETHVNAHHHQHHHRGRHRCQHRYVCGQSIRSTKAAAATVLKTIIPGLPLVLWNDDDNNNKDDDEEEEWEKKQQHETLINIKWVCNIPAPSFEYISKRSEYGFLHVNEQETTKKIISTTERNQHAGITNGNPKDKRTKKTAAASASASVCANGCDFG